MGSDMVYAVFGGAPLFVGTHIFPFDVDDDARFAYRRNRKLAFTAQMDTLSRTRIGAHYVDCVAVYPHSYRRNGTDYERAKSTRRGF